MMLVRFKKRLALQLALDTKWVTVCPTQSTTYKLKVENNKGCEIEDKVTILVYRNGLLYAPNAFSPNGDGNNDYFMLYAKNNVISKINYFRIYDRAGNQVFNAANLLPNEFQNGWNGRFKGQAVGNGVYLWIAEIVWKDNQKEIVKGDVTLLR